MVKSNNKVFRIVATSILTAVLLLAGSCNNWMSNDDFMEKIESEVHDANATAVTVYVRYANAKMGTTEPQGNTTMKVDVASKVTAVTAEDYGFVKWAAFSTKDFATSKQHSNLTYLSEDNYNANFKDKELPSSVVYFSKPTEAVTDVKILQVRSDIFIIPVVAARPTYVQSVPANADSGVVKNTSIRILFSKPIKKESLKDSEGNLNYSVSSSAAILTDDDQEMESKDITDLFVNDVDSVLSSSGKMLTLKLKPDAILDNRQRITVTLYEGLCDKDGFSMNGNYTFSFQTGTQTDSLSPIIEVIVGVEGQINFVSYHADGTDGEATKAAKAAKKDINDANYTPQLLAQRVYDKLNLYVKASDLIGAGENVIPDSSTLSEDNVAYIGISASLYVDKDGKAVTAAKENPNTLLEKQNLTYVSGSIDSKSEIKKLFSEVVPLDKDGKKYSGGTIYTYDLSDLEDGLIKIDIWGIDMVGNNGSDGAEGSIFYDKYDNGYKSIFVIKDSTPPDSKTEAKKIISNSDVAPYYWYNSENLSSMKLFDDASDESKQIVDAGHIKLRSLAKNLKWTFAVGKTQQAPAATDSSWKYIHDQNTGASIKYDLSSAKAPSADGPVDITLFISDDMGNVSEPVLLDSIMYDNTKPVVTLKAGLGDFVDATTGQSVLHASSDKVISQVLKVDFKEENAQNNVSGIRRMEIHVKKGDAEVAVPLDAAKFAVKYAPASIENPTPVSEGVRTIAMAANDGATSDNIKVFNVTDTTKITSGTLFIYGLTLGDEDGTYNVLVDLYDSALNKTPKTEITNIARDTTDPVVSKVQVMDAKARKVYGQNVETWWLPYDKFETADSLSKVTLKITAKESGSGIGTIKLADNAEFTENTKLYVGTTLLAKGTDYTYDAENNTLKLTDWFTPKLINAANATHVITLENIKLNNINAAAGTTQGNKIKVKVTDFVDKTNTDSNTIYYGDTTVTGTLVYADSIAPEIATLKVEDSQDNTAGDIDNKTYNKAGYTNNQNVVLTLTLGNTETGNKGSGVDKIILTDNAAFTDSTQIYLNTNASPLVKGANGDYEITTENGKSVVNFKKVFTEAETLKFTNVKIVSAVNGNQVVKADVQDFAGIKSTASKPTQAIVYDNVAPVANDTWWDNLSTGVTAGTEKDMTVDTQSLRIDFTEATAGIKLIKFDIKRQGQQTAYGLPFANAGFKLSYKPANGTVAELVKDTDYSIVTNETDQNFKQYIKLENTYTSGSFFFDNLTLTNANTEATYTIDVVMLDAAENRVDCQQSIAIDSIAPVIPEVLYIPNLIHAKELTSSNGTPLLGETTGSFWLTREQQGNSSGGKAPTNIPVYINIEETNSGVKVIKFLNDVVLDSTKTKLYTATSKSDSTGVAVAEDKYIVNPTDNTITIKNTRDCFKAASGTFTLLVKGVGFKNVDGTEWTNASNNKASKNLISVKLSDVAMNESAAKSTSEPAIYSDSRAPAAATNFRLLDRGTTSDTIKASEDYTNESIVNMKFQLEDCEKTGSGYHSFTINGATFTNNTKITMKTSSGSNDIVYKYENNGTQTSTTELPFELSSDKKTLTLKTTSQKYVIRQKVEVTITNVEFATSGTGQKTVTLTAYDLAGWNQTGVSDSIYFDNTPPVLEKLFTANYTSSGVSYYKPTINVYPHANGENATGVMINYGTETAPLNVPTFYTATTCDTGFYQFNGQVSASSGSLNTNFSYKAVLGIRAKDTLSLGGYAGARAGETEAKTFLYYIADPDFSKTKAQILTGTNHATDINAARAITTSGNSKTSAALSFPFATGQYSAVIVDEAGNVSDIFHFAVVADISKPGVTGMQERVLLQTPEGANIYRSAVQAVVDGTCEPRGEGSSTTGISFKATKYVTKKSENKYKIILNLGPTYASSTSITKLDGSAPGTTTTYGEFAAQSNNSPIEQYAISTWYGAWPDGAHYSYNPSIPYTTYLPDGTCSEAADPESNALNPDPTVAKIREYFGFSSSFVGAYRAAQGKTSWHNYKAGESYTDTGNGIKSSIDANNNLIIEIPNTTNTAPVSVFLRDGCGNMNYVVLGMKAENSTTTAPCFVIDNKLGSHATTNGVVTTPVIVQNPYITTPAKTTNKITWNGKQWDWNNQSGNGDKADENNGVAETFGFMKDKTKLATYYNPRIYIDENDRIQAYTGNTSKENWPKLALTLQYNSAYPEDVSFASDEKMPIVGASETATPNSALDYTCRALLYCTTDVIDLTTKTYQEVYNMIVNSHKEGSVQAGDKGFRSEWMGVKHASTGQIEIVLDYPQPDYATLGWTVQNSTTHEPIPYYIWYIYEDRVGNYEIGKVVNSNVTGNDLKSNTHTGYDLWLYDGEAPVVTVVGTDGKKPNEIGNTQEEINKLVSANNGYVPYLDSTNKRIWVSVDPNRSLRASNLAKSTTGWGVTNTVEDDSNGSIVTNRSYLPFANLQVSKEITGIRAFCWSTNELPPPYTASISDNNTQGDRVDTDYPYGAWFAGNGTDRNAKENLPATKFDIGWGNYDYKYEGNKYLQTSAYSRRYTGTKINTVLSHKLIKASADSVLYLHVMDWTGNVVSYRMGSAASGLKFKNDTTAPVWRSGTSVTSKPSEYFVNVEGGALTVRIAGNGKGSDDPNTGRQTMYIEFPEEYFSENTTADPESGIAGYALNVPNGENLTQNLILDNLTKDVSGNYLAVLEIPYDIYENWGTTSTNVYFTAFDNVGNNRGDYYFHAILDTTPPELDSVSVVIKKNSGGNFCDEEKGLGTNAASYNNIDYYRDYKNHADGSAAPAYYDSVVDIPSAQLQTVYISKQNIARFHVNMKEVPGDFDNITVNKWNATGWETKASVSNGKITRSGTSLNYYLGDTTDSSGFDILECTTSGVIYQICATDKAGNTSCQYFKLILDNQGPELVARTDSTSKTPTIELGKGSINGWPLENPTTYYYTAAAGKELKINFAMKDAGMKNTKQRLWYSFNSAVVASTPDESKWIEITPSDDGATNVTAKITSGNIEKIYFKDLLGNISTLTPPVSGANADFEGYKYSYGSNSKTITKLTYWDKTPSTPSISDGDNGNVQTSAAYDNNDWDKTHAKQSDDYVTDHTIIITSQDRRQLKVSFTKPENENIIGYLVTDELGKFINNSEYFDSENQYAAQAKQQRVLDTKLSAVPNYDVDAYSFVTTLGTEFTEWLPLLVNNGLNEAKAAVTRKYYAVDIVGNISEPLTVVYSYTDANHQASDIRLIKNYNNDTGIQSDAKADIDKDITDGKIKLAQIVNNNGTWFFNDGFLLLECTLKKKADSDNNDIPTKVELRDIWGGDWANFAIRGYASQANNTNGNLVFKVYPSDHTVSGGTSSGRYYCYIAFKVGNDVGPDDNKVWTLDGFYNNDQWGGSQLYAKIFGKSNAESDAISLNPEVAGADNKPRWKRDITGPAITGSYLGTQGSANNVTKYTPSGTISIVYDKDKNNSWTGKSNSYSSGLTIKIPAAGILDGITYSGDSGSVNNGQFVNYSGVAQYRTLVTGTDGEDSDWQSLVPSDDGYYTIPVSDVTSVHSEIKLWIRDSLGNTSKEYKIGGPTDANSAWWILNNCLTESGTTVTAPTAGWIANTDSVFDVTPPAGSIIKSVTAKVGNTDLTVKGISFNGYNGVPTVKINNVQTDVPMSDGWLNLSGLKVTVAPIAQGWDPKSVTIILNDTVSKTVDFVPAKKLSATDISLTKATWSSTGTTFDVGITMNGGDNAPSIDKLDGMTREAYLGNTKLENVTVGFDKNNKKFTLSGTGIPKVKTWTEQVIKIKLSGDNIVEGGITLDAMTISPISASEIEIKQLVTSGETEAEQAIAWDSATVDPSTGERTLKLKFNCPTAIPSGTTISSSIGSISDISYTNQTAILKVKKAWEEKNVTITIGEVAKENVLTVRAIDASDITVTSSPAAWASGTTEYTITVSVKGDVTLAASDFSVSNATISTAWNASTSTLKIKPVDQSWTTDQDVVVTVHNVVTPKILTVLKRTLVDGDITLGTPSYDSTNKRYYMSVTRNNGVSKDNLASVSATNATTNVQISDSEKICFSSDKTKIYFYSSKLPAKLWNQQQLINLTITASNGSSITKTSVLTVEAIAAGDIKIQFVNNGTPENITSNTWNTVTADANGEKVFPLKITAPSALPQDCVVKYGEQTLSFDANDTTHSIVLLPLKQKVTSQTVSLTVNGITKDNVMTIPARNLAAGDITVSTATWSEGTTSYELNISYFNGASKSNISSITTDSGVTVTLDTNKTKVTLKNVSKGWTQNEIKLKLNNSIDLGVVLTVPAKVPADYITVTPTTPTAWAANTTSVTFTVASSDNTLSIQKVLYGGTELTKSNNAYTITAPENQSIAADVEITVNTKHDNVETAVTKRIFPITGQASRFLGRTIKIDGIDDTYTFGYTPSSVAALQTKVIELPSVINKTYETFVTGVEMVASVPSALPSINEIATAQPQKSSKKATKKAAKKNSESAAATAAVDTAVQIADTLDTTELPAQALEVPAVEDQMAMLLPKTANTEEPAVKVEATLSTTNVMPADEATPAKHSAVAIWVVLIALAAAVVGIVVGCKKKRFLV